MPRGFSFLLVMGAFCAGLASMRYHEELNAIFTTSTPEAVRMLCETPHFQTRIVSYSPLISHLEDFISPTERQRLLDLAYPRFTRSRIGVEGEESAVRDSHSAFLPSSDPTIQCLVERAAAFQGYAPLSHFEVVQAVKYHAYQRFDAHYDWRGNATRDRQTSFFAILEANCTSCGTRFHRVPFNAEVNHSFEDERWCDVIDCEAKELTFRPRPGSAIFWRNLDDYGAGDKRTMHAGLPVDVDGAVKVGSNIWTNTISGR